jgi:hypothetical protein
MEFWNNGILGLRKGNKFVGNTCLPAGRNAGAGVSFPLVF